MKKESATDDLIVELPKEKEDKAQLALPLDKDGLPEVGELKPEPAVVETKTEPRLAKEAKANDEAVEALKAQIKRLEEERNLERSAREQAQAEAAARRAEAEEATGRASNSEVEMVNGYIQAAKAKADAVRREIRSARAGGDHDRADDLQMEAATIAARLMQYEDARRSLDERPKEKTEPKRVDPVDPFEQRIQTLSEPSKNWLRSHRECITDSKSNAKLTAGHYSAVADGLRPDTTDYFAYIEKHMGYAKDEVDDDGEDVELETPAPRKSSAAPVSRRSAPDPKTGYIGNGQYQLTRAEAEHAEAMGMTPTEYLKNKIEIAKNNRYANG